MTARFLVTGAPHPLPAQAEIALLRAAQEGTANIRKHARAGEAVLTLSYLDDRVILDVRDDGRGFDAAAADGHRGDVSRWARPARAQGAPGDARGWAGGGERARGGHGARGPGADRSGLAGHRWTVRKT